MKLAEKSLEYDEYARALLYLEDYIHDNEEKLQEHLPTLSVCLNLTCQFFLKYIFNISHLFNQANLF